MEPDPRKPNVKKMGEFPFELEPDGQESPYLTWIRDHSNYWAAGGPLDYLRALSVLARGIAINFLVFLPWLFLIAIAVAAYHLNPVYRSWIVIGALVMGVALCARSHLAKRAGDGANFIRRGGWLLVVPFAAWKAPELDPWGWGISFVVICGALWRPSRFAGRSRVRRSLLVAGFSALAVQAMAALAGWQGGSSPNMIEMLWGSLVWFVVICLALWRPSELASQSRAYRSLWVVPFSALAVAATYRLAGWERPFGLTVTVLILMLVMFLSFPLATPLFKIARHRQVHETGSDSSVVDRDAYERSFGILFFAVVACALFEAAAYVVPSFHAWHTGRLPAFQGLTWPAGALIAALAVLVGGATAAVFGDRGAARKVGILLVALLGALIPLLVVLYAADVLIFQPPNQDLFNYIFVIIAVGLAWLILLAGVGWKSDAFSARESWGLFAVASTFAVFVLTVGVWGNEAALERLNQFRVSERTFTSMVPDLLDGKSRTVDVSDDVSRLASLLGDSAATVTLSDLVSAKRDLDRLVARLSQSSSGDTGDDRPDPVGASIDQALESIEWPTTAPKDPTPAAVSTLLRIQPPPTDSTLERILQVEWNVWRPPSVGFQESLGPGSWLDSLRIALQKDNPDRDDHIRLFASEAEAELGRVGWWVEEGPVGLVQRTLVSLRAVVDAPRSDTVPKDPSLVADVEELLDLGKLLGNGSALQELDAAIPALRRRWVEEAALGGYPQLSTLPEAIDYRLAAYRYKLVALLMFSAVLYLLFSFTIDVNLTSIHGLNRDRLASAFLIGVNKDGDIDIEEDLDLYVLAQRDSRSRSTAPYHLINSAVNLQSTNAPGVRDRKSDCFVFSKLFTGGRLTGYCRSRLMEQLYPQMDLGTAMAISAAAASPNMGRNTHPGLVPLMTLLNVRMGFWVPHPGRLERREGGQETNDDNGFSFDHVFREELNDIDGRWTHMYGGSRWSHPEEPRPSVPTVRHKLVGIAYSGGGIRSATVNLGITQALHAAGVFDHIDYMSTVSGGGYLGSCISALMRKKEVSQPGELSKSRDEVTPYRSIHRWQVPARALVREALGRVDERWRWVNVADGAHIENLATIELLRRRCKYIIVGDGEADPQHHFNGLANLMQLARIDLGIEIDIDLDGLRLTGEGTSGTPGADPATHDHDAFTASHWAIGEVRYPERENTETGKVEPRETGYLLYLKSSMTGDEDEVIREYRARSPSFPHESTADQAFSEGQFEAYRSLGQHIGEQVLSHASKTDSEELVRGRPTLAGERDYRALEQWFTILHERASSYRKWKRERREEQMARNVSGGLAE